MTFKPDPVASFGAALTIAIICVLVFAGIGFWTVLASVIARATCQ